MRRQISIAICLFALGFLSAHLTVVPGVAAVVDRAAAAVERWYAAAEKFEGAIDRIDRAFGGGK